MSEEPETTNSPEPNPAETTQPETAGTTEERQSTLATEETNASTYKLDWDAVTLPEKFSIEDGDRTAVEEIAVKYSLPPEALSDLFQMYAAKVAALGDGLAAATAEEWTTTNETWKSEVIKTYGSLEKAQAESARFAPIIEEYGGDELREALEVTGAGNHPGIFKFLSKIADAFGEGSPVTAAATPKTTNPLQVMYNKSPELFNGAD